MTHLVMALVLAEAKAPLIMPAWAFPLIAAIIFTLLGFIVWSYRDVANRHSDRVKPGSSSGHDAGHGDADSHH